jgi:hypothetical protein
MASERPTRNRLLAPTKKPAKTSKLPTRSQPIQRAIQLLSDGLDALNERITELDMKVTGVTRWTC